jgi:hypothetical protein
MSSGLTLAEAAIAINTTTEVVERLTAALPALAPGDAGLSLRQVLGLRVLTALHFLDAADAVPIADKAVAEARAGGSRCMAVKWTGSARWTWTTDDVDAARLAGPVLLLPVERMLTDLALRCAEVRASLPRLN